ncbi:MAG TPA: YhcH/YjgK/YiaL family protein [Abditibacteriaceae bacterium]|jgi:YhcH/YjgK/YiaL family protein
MILDTLDNAHRYFALSEHFQAAFAWLQQNPNAAEGRYEIAGDNCFVMVQRAEPKGKDEPFVEAHNRYLDIHVTLEGVDEIGWKPRANCQDITHEYNAETDAAFWADWPDFYVSVAPGQFCVVFPSDAHAPSSGAGDVLKAVFKIAV